MATKFLYGDITEKILAASFKVHNELGNGFQEVIYQRCLVVEFERMGLPFEREREQTIYYEGISVGARRVDFLVDGKVLVELKAVVALDNIHLAQAINYVEAFNLEVGLLINFGSTSLQFRRLKKKERK